MNRPKGNELDMNFVLNEAETELANEFVEFLKENDDFVFLGKIRDKKGNYTAGFHRFMKRIKRVPNVKQCMFKLRNVYRFENLHQVYEFFFNNYLFEFDEFAVEEDVECITENVSERVLLVERDLALEQIMLSRDILRNRKKHVTFVKGISFDIGVEDICAEAFNDRKVVFARFAFEMEDVELIVNQLLSRFLYVSGSLGDESSANKEWVELILEDVILLLNNIPFDKLSVNDVVKLLTYNSAEFLMKLFDDYGDKYNAFLENDTSFRTLVMGCVKCPDKRLGSIYTLFNEILEDPRFIIMRENRSVLGRILVTNIWSYEEKLIEYCAR